MSKTTIGTAEQARILDLALQGYNAQGISERIGISEILITPFMPTHEERHSIRAWLKANNRNTAIHWVLAQNGAKEW